MRFLAIVFLFCAPSSVYASLFITEIMYDVDGADTGKEWVEIQNTGSSVDLTGWKLFEGGVNHGLTLVQGNASISQNGFAIIADSAEKFLLDWPSFSGDLFDSSFSLSNTGETLTLRDSNLADADSVAYLSDWGANGDGNSLQKINNKWISALPTPGKESSGSAATEETSKKNELEQISGSISEPSPATFSAYAGEDRQVLAGAEVYFEGQVRGVEENMISKTRFLWNFGDGTTGEGKNIKHIFQYPGTYIVTLNASLGAYSDSDSIKIIVSPANVSFSEIKPGEWIEIQNASSKISDISGFAIQIDNSKIFNFSKDTKFAANSFLVFDSLIMGFEIPDAGEIKILYPNGKILFSSRYEAKNLSENESIGFDNGIWKKSEVTPGVKNSIKKEPNVANATVGKPVTANTKSIKENYEAEKYIEDASKEASIINSKKNASFWSEIKWLVFGLGGGILIGVVYFLIKNRFFSKTEQSIS